MAFAYYAFGISFAFAAGGGTAYIAKVVTHYLMGAS